MIRNPRLRELLGKRSILKGEGLFREAIPLQLEIIELLQEEDANRCRLALAHNMASVLYLRSKLYSSAEWHGRQALALHFDDSVKGHQTRGSLNRNMAQILACGFEFEEAARFGQIAIEEYSYWHNSTDEFLIALIHEVESMKNRTWAAPE